VTEIKFDIAKQRQARRTALDSRLASLTLPPGALDGVFSPLLQILSAEASVGAQGQLQPWALLFAADHGVAMHHQVSPFPTSVTAHMVANFLRGRAAMSVLSARRKMPLEIVNVGVANDLPIAEQPCDAVCYHNWTCKEADTMHKVFLESLGSRDLSQEDALSRQEHQRIFQRAYEFVRTGVLQKKINLLVLGEMGIGNTTASAALSCVLLNEKPKSVTGRGTGAQGEIWQNKLHAVEKGLRRFASEHVSTRHAFVQQKPTENDAHILLSSLGGKEISALAGAALGAFSMDCCVLLDGVIATSAVAPFVLAHPQFQALLVAGHLSPEPAHQKLLSLLELKPLLDLGLRLGEGSGAALALGLLQDAKSLFDDIATFAEAGMAP
jgi:nicotinate-nucleotide--dimethylbenzimidazole phosphoribosyltransferase